MQCKTFNGTDSVLLIVSGWTNLYSEHYLFPQKRYRTFVKDIGLTSDILVDTTSNDTLSKKILIGYYVNHTF